MNTGFSLCAAIAVALTLGLALTASGCRDKEQQAASKPPPPEAAPAPAAPEPPPLAPPKPEAFAPATRVRLPERAWFIALDGKPENDGSKESPWDIASGLDGSRKVEPDSVVYLRSGVYRRRAVNPKTVNDWQEKFDVKLAGAEGKPIHVMPAPGEHVIIDGGIAVQDPAKDLWIWNLEILVSEPNATAPVEAGSHPGSFMRPWGGLHVFGGRNIKFIDLNIHNCRQGVSWWTGNSDSEMYGTVIYDNGWPATDRGHGHAIYTQNQFENGAKTIRDCLFTGGFGWTMHAYGSKNAYVDKYAVTHNVAWNGGPFLVGGGRPSRGIVVTDNYLYNVGMQIGYNAPSNEDCTVRGNVIGNGGLSVNRYQNINGVTDPAQQQAAIIESNTIVAKDTPRPPDNLVALRPSAYDANRANLVIYNWQKAGEVVVPTGDFVLNGEPCRLYDPKRLYGEPVHVLTCDAGRIVVPMDGEFAAYVVITRFGPRDDAAWKDAQRLQAATNISERAETLYDQGKAPEALALLREKGYAQSELCRRLETVTAAVAAAEEAHKAGNEVEASRQANAALAAETNAGNAYAARAQALRDTFDRMALAKLEEAKKAGSVADAARLCHEAAALAPEKDEVVKAIAKLKRDGMFQYNLALNLIDKDAGRARQMLEEALLLLPPDDPLYPRAKEALVKMKDR